MPLSLSKMVHAKAIARATTDHSGHYTLIAPTKGIYRETITAAGFRTGVFNNLQLSGGVMNLPDAMLQMGSATETIEVNEPLEVAGGQIATMGHVGILGDLEVQDTPVWMDGSLHEKIILGRANIQLSPKWTLTSGSGFSHENSANPAYCPVVILDYTGTTLCEQINQATRNDHYSNDVGIRGKFNTGSFSHLFMAGWNRIQQTNNFGPFQDFGPSQPYNLYLAYRPTAPNFILPELSTDFVIDDQSTKGWYLGDTLGVFRDRLLLTGGFRLVTQTIKDSVRDNSIPPESYRESAVSPSVAGLFKLTSHVSLYGNFIQALEAGWIAPIGTKNAGQVLPPYFSNQSEFGAKADWGAWLGTFALYRISQANGVESAVTNPPTFIQDGRQINKGLEVSFAGDLDV